MGEYRVHVEHAMLRGEELCESMRLTWYLSPNDKSRCFDWELPLGSAAEVGGCVVVSETGVELASAILDQPWAPVLLVYFGRSFEDEWLEVTATIRLRGEAQRMGRLRYDNDRVLSGRRHYALNVRLSAAFADQGRIRAVGYFKSPNMWRPPQDERATLAPGSPAVLEFGPYGDNSYTLAWDLCAD